jgi:hypothetical protein
MSCYYNSHLIILLGSYVGVLGRLWSQNDVIMSWLSDSHLKLLPTSILDIYKVPEHIDILSMGIQYQPYTVMPTLHGSKFWVLGLL